MDTVIQQFRSAIGGFNRRDVQQYIEELTARHGKETEELKRLMNEAEQRCSEAEEARFALENEKNAMAAEESKLRSSLEESTRTLAQLRGAQNEMEVQLATAKREAEQYRAMVEDLAPRAESYDQLKERVATVELDAHRKAQAIVDEAASEAERVRADAKAWLQEVLEQYQAVRSGMDGLLEQARTLGLLAEQTGPLEEQAERLRSMGGLT